MKTLAILLSTMLIAACPSRDWEKGAAAAASAGVQEDLSPGLKGTDANANGIRDDIDALITSKYSQTPAIKKAAEQKALALQAFMEATTKEQAFAAAEKISIASKCVYTVLPGISIENSGLRDGMSKDIESLTANTRERLVKYLQSNKLVGGGYFTAPIAPFCN
jgi:hypothetical protein